MAGLMDFLEPVLSRSYYKNKRKEERAAQYQGLLDEYRGSNDASEMPRSSSSPNMGPQGLMGGGQQGGSGYLPPQFFQRASAIPGFEQYGLQDQVGGQNMQAQMQRQAYEGSNMSAYQTEQVRQAQENSRLQADYYTQNMAAQQGRYEQTRADKLPGGMLYKEEPQQAQPMEPPPGWIGSLKPPTTDVAMNPNWSPDSDSPQWVAKPGTARWVKEDSAAKAYELASTWFPKAQALNEEGGFNQRDNPAANDLMAEFQNSVLPAYSASMDTGAITEGDIDQVKAAATDFIQQWFEPNRLLQSSENLQLQADAKTRAGTLFYVQQMQDHQRRRGMRVMEAADFLDSQGNPPAPKTPDYYTYLAIKEQENASKKRRGRL